MATKSVITKIRRKKMAEASHTTGKIAKITHIALGSGGVTADGTVIVPLAGECGTEERGGKETLYLINQDFRHIL